MRLASCDANGAVVYPAFPLRPLGGFRSSGWQRAAGRPLGVGRVGTGNRALIRWPGQAWCGIPPGVTSGPSRAASMKIVPFACP